MPLILIELPLLALLTPIILYVLAKTEAVWLRPLIQELAAVLRKVWIVGGTIADSLLTIEHNVAHYMNTQVLAAEQPVVKWLGAARTFVVQVFYTAANTAVETGRAIEQLAHLLEHEVAVPAKVTWRKVTRTVYRIDKRTAAKIAAAAAALLALKHVATVTVPGAIEGEITDLRDYVNRKANTLARAIKHAEKKVAIGALTAGVTWAAIRRVKLGWLRCGGVNRIGKSLCGMTGLIEALFADAVGAFLITDLCGFVNGVQSAAKLATPFLMDWVDVEDVLIGCHGATKPPPVPIPHYSPTPVIAALAL